MEYGMGGTTCVTSNASGITKANGSELEGKKVAVPLGTMADYVFDCKYGKLLVLIQS
jgi:taurine transport system substrate-binding protein